jgi:branched-chain amino acid transport system substrate-binding protein
MKKLLVSIGVVLIGASLIGASLVGCSSTASTATTTALQKQTILIGTDSPLTGQAAGWGLGVEHGVQLAFQDVNAAGGLTIGNINYTFKVVSLDDQYDMATAVNNIRTLVNTDGCKYIFTFQPDSAVAVAPELATEKVIQFTVSEPDAVIQQPQNATTFRTFVPASMQAPSYVAWIAKNYPNVHTTDIITGMDLNGNTGIAATSNACKQAGITVDTVVQYTDGTMDFTPFITKLMADNPDMISIPEVGSGDCASIIKTLRDSGYKGVISAESKPGASDIVGVTGEADIEGVICDDLALIAPQASTIALALPAREVAKWGSSYSDTYDFYTQATLMFTAMQRANSVDTTAVKNILQDPTQSWPYVALTGATAKFDGTTAQALYGANATNQISCPYGISVIHNGQDTVAGIVSIP